MEKLKVMSEKAGQNFTFNFCKKCIQEQMQVPFMDIQMQLPGLLFINYPNLTPKKEMMKQLMRLLRFTSFTFEHFWESPPVNTPSDS